MPEGPERPTFLDVPQSHWAYRHVEECAREDIVRGVGTIGGDPIYEPALVANRGQMAIFVARGLAGGEAGVAEWTGAASFADVDVESSACKYVEYLAARGIVAGYPDGLYHPERECTRDQMAVFLWRAFLEQ